MFELNHIPNASETIIRPSGLSDYGDCARRAAARLFAEDVKRKGFTLRQLRPHIGGAVGTAVHTARAALLNKKLEGKTPSTTEAISEAVARFEADIADGVNWDSITKTKDEAINQMAGLIKSYSLYILPQENPRFIEKRVRKPLGDGYILQGTMDGYDRSSRIIDAKTGTRNSNHTFQVGSYSLGLKEEGETPEEAQIHWLQRRKEPQPPVLETYDLKTAETAALAMALRLKQEHQHFVKTGNEWSFAPNPNTHLCGEKYCPAWGTDFCTLWREKE